MASQITAQAPAQILEVSRALQAANRRRNEARQQDGRAAQSIERTAARALAFADSQISRAAGRRDPWRGAVPEFEPVRRSFARVTSPYVFSRTFYTLSASVVGDKASVTLAMETKLQTVRIKTEQVPIIESEITVYTGSASLSLNGIAEAFAQQLVLPTSIGIKHGGNSSFQATIVSAYEVIENTQAPLRYVSPIPSVVIRIQGGSQWFTVTNVFNDPVTGQQVVFQTGTAQGLNLVTTLTGVANSGSSWLTQYVDSNPVPPPASAKIEFVSSFSLVSGLSSSAPQTLQREVAVTIKEPRRSAPAAQP